MTVTAEPLTFHSARSRVRVRMANKACRARVAVPAAVHTRHVSADVRLRVGTLDSIRVGMACHACRVGAFRTMTRRAAFQVAPRHLRMLAAAAPHTDCYKPRLTMPARFERFLINIPSRSVARRAKLFLPVTRLAIGKFTFCRDSVCKLEIQIVHFRERTCLTTVDRLQARSTRRRQILLSLIHACEDRSSMTVVAGFLRMAGSATCPFGAGICHASKTLVLADEIRPVVVLGS